MYANKTQKKLKFESADDFSILIQSLLIEEPAKGIVFGEYHRSRASIQFLIDHAKDLQDAKVKYLFTEKFPPKIPMNRLHRECFKPESNFAYLNRKYTMYNLLKEMDAVGIQVIGVDVEDESNPYLAGKRGERERHDRSIALNNFVVETYKKYMSGGTVKSIFLLGAGHAGSFITSRGNTIPGVATLLNMPSVIIHEDGFENLLEILVLDPEKETIEVALEAGIAYRVRYFCSDNDESINETTEESILSDCMISVPTLEPSSLPHPWYIRLHILSQEHFNTLQTPKRENSSPDFFSEHSRKKATTEIAGSSHHVSTQRHRRSSDRFSHDERRTRPASQPNFQFRATREAEGSSAITLSGDSGSSPLTLPRNLPGSRPQCKCM